MAKKSKPNPKQIKLYCRKIEKPAAEDGVKWRKCICVKWCKIRLGQIANNSIDPSEN